MTDHRCRLCNLFGSGNVSGATTGIVSSHVWARRADTSGAAQGPALDLDLNTVPARVTSWSWNKVLETARMRGLLQRERVLSTLDGTVDLTRTANFGLLAAGAEARIDSFVNRFTGPILDESDTTTDPFQRVELKSLVHELDWSVAPMVGHVETVIDVPTTNQTARIDAFESEAQRTNIGLVVIVHRWFAASSTAYRYDPTQDLYVAESGTTGSTTGARWSRL